MAERTLFGIGGMARTADQREREARHRRRQLRIAIRQVERAELYLVALGSLGLDDSESRKRVQDLVQRLQALQRHFIELRDAARP